MTREDVALDEMHLRWYCQLANVDRDEVLYGALHEGVVNLVMKAKVDVITINLTIEDDA